MAFHPRLFYMIDEGGIRIMSRIVDFFDCAVIQNETIDNAWSCGNDIDIEFPLDPFENNL